VISIVLFKIPANDLMFKLAHRQGWCLMQCIDCLRVGDLYITVSFYNYMCEHMAYMWKKVSSVNPHNIFYVFIIFLFMVNIAMLFVAHTKLVWIVRWLMNND
jgi:hypothetical protein